MAATSACSGKSFPFICMAELLQQQTYSVEIKAWSRIAWNTSLTRSRVVMVWPWYIIGIMSGPSQQSTETDILLTCIKIEEESMNFIGNFFTLIESKFLWSNLFKFPNLTVIAQSKMNYIPRDLHDIHTSTGRTVRGSYYPLLLSNFWHVAKFHNHLHSIHLQPIRNTRM